MKRKRRQMMSLAERQAEMRVRQRDSEMVMSAEQAAQYTGLSPDELHSFLRKIGNRWCFVKDELDRWIKYRAQQAAEYQSKRRLKVMDLEEAALYLELSPATLQRYIREQKIPARQRGWSDSFTKPMLDGWLRPKTPNPKLTPSEEEQRLMIRGRYHFDKTEPQAATLEQKQAEMRERMQAEPRQRSRLALDSQARSVG